MNAEIVLEVLGLPEPQGSMLPFIDKRTGKPRLKPGNETALKRWRRKITAVAKNSMYYNETLLGGVEVIVVFAFDRPAGHYRTGHNAQLLRDNAPPFPDTQTTKDIDKLLRACFDALTDAGVWLNDAQVVDVRARKRWAGESVHAPDVPGMRIQIQPALVREGVLI